MSNSKRLFKRSQKFIPGGVNSPVRSFKNVGGNPLYIKKALGARVWDEDDREYLDFVGTWGPAILGHAPEIVIESVNEASSKGLSFGFCHEKELKMANFICNSVDSVDKVRMVNSGTEATMTAIRLARGFTGKKYIVKFSGCYHGHVDSLLVAAGSGAQTHGVPDSLGIPTELSNLTCVVKFNDINALREVFKKNGDEIAGVILEPVMGNAGLILPKNDFLNKVESLCKEFEALLIFDEVMTGFRLDRGGVQKIHGVKPDLSAFGKVIGGGLPVGAIGGRAEIMDHLSPNGGVYQAGTLSGNPLSLSAGLAQLEELARLDGWTKLEEIGAFFEKEVKSIIKKSEIQCNFVRTGSMFAFFFCEEEINCFEDLGKNDADLFIQFFNHLLRNGILIAPSAFEVGFLSLAHDYDEINVILNVISDFFLK